MLDHGDESDDNRGDKNNDDDTIPEHQHCLACEAEICIKAFGNSRKANKIRLGNEQTGRNPSEGDRNL